MQNLNLHFFKALGLALLLAILTSQVALAQIAPHGPMVSDLLMAQTPPNDQTVYDLLKVNKQQEALDTLNELSKTEKLSWPLKAQKVYILLELNRNDEAAAWLKTLKPNAEQADEYKLLQAVVAERFHHYDDAYAGYHSLENSHDPEVAKQAKDQLQYLPDENRQDKWLWGSLEGFGTYYGRYGLVAGQAELREGTYIPDARWIKPYVAFTYLGDSRSNASGSPVGLSNLYSQNLAGVKAGITAKPFSDLDINFYVEGGEDRDLINSPEHHGQWFADVQGGVNGFAAWGPGAILRPGADVQFNLDWYTSFGGDFSYYSRIPDAICYLQAQQGVRLVQFGQKGAFDGYVAENSSNDIRGSFFDNYLEIGPGTRFIYQPLPGVTATLDGGYFNGAYLGLNGLHDRAGRDTTYGEARVTASLSVNW